MIYLNNVIFVFLIILLVGLFIGIGSCIVFFVKKINIKFFFISLGFFVGVMIYVFMIEIFFKV